MTPPSPADPLSTPGPGPRAAQPVGGPPAVTGLGLDAGGTGTRWAAVAADGSLLGQGVLPSVSGALLATGPGRAQAAAALSALAHLAPPGRVVAGITGWDDALAPAWQALLRGLWPGAPPRAWAMTDIELLCRAAFEPGRGILVLAGTGSVAAQLQADGSLARCGGRGAVIDDAGSGHWIAAQALQRVWRGEDEEPGRWRRSALARAVLARIGGPGWAETRRWVQAATRGELGELAQAVAAAAHEGDDQALALLRQAGIELARLPRVLMGRVGPQPLALAGRVWELHPVLREAFVGCLPPSHPAQMLQAVPHHVAARLALHAPAVELAHETVPLHRG